MGKVIQWPIVMVPSVDEQLDIRTDIIIQTVMKHYADELAVGVGLACTAAEDAIRSGASFEQAMDAADRAIVTHKEKMLRIASAAYDYLEATEAK